MHSSRGPMKSTDSCYESWIQEMNAVDTETTVNVLNVAGWWKLSQADLRGLEKSQGPQMYMTYKGKCWDKRRKNGA